MWLSRSELSEIIRNLIIVQNLNQTNRVKIEIEQFNIRER